MAHDVDMGLIGITWSELTMKNKSHLDSQYQIDLVITIISGNGVPLQGSKVPP